MEEPTHRQANEKYVVAASRSGNWRPTEQSAVAVALAVPLHLPRTRLCLCVCWYVCVHVGGPGNGRRYDFTNRCSRQRRAVSRAPVVCFLSQTQVSVRSRQVVAMLLCYVSLGVCLPVCLLATSRKNTTGSSWKFCQEMCVCGQGKTDKKFGSRPLLNPDLEEFLKDSSTLWGLLSPEKLNRSWWKFLSHIYLWTRKSSLHFGSHLDHES